MLFPDLNELDLRYRSQAKARPQVVVSIASAFNMSDHNYHKLSDFIQSVERLYPTLQGTAPVGQIDLQINPIEYHLVHLIGWQLLNLEEQQLDTCNEYLQTGGVILIEVPTNGSILTEDIKNLIAYHFEIPLQSWQELSRTHPLRTKPFVFAGLPHIDEQLLRISNAG